MKKKVIATLLSAAMVTSLLVGCGNSSTATEEPAAEEATEEEATEEAEEEAEEEVEEATEEAEATDEAAAANAAASGADWDNLDPENMSVGSVFEGLEAADNYDIQILVKAYSNSYWQAFTGGAQQAADEFGVTLNAQGPNTESDIADQINMFNAAINNKPTGIGIASCDASSTIDSLNTAKEQGVPIVACDTTIDDAPEGTLLATVATDSIAAGKVAAQHVYDAISYKAADGKIRVGMVAQDVVSGSHQQRGLGFVLGMVENGQADGYKVAVVGTDYFIDRASETLTLDDEADADIIVECAIPSQALLDLCATECSAIMNKEDTVAIYTTGQTVAEGLVAANDNLGVLGSDPETSILGVGFDAGSILKENVSNGTLFGAITQMPNAMGYFTVCTLIANANGDSVSDMEIPGYWYDATNMDDPLIAPNLYD